MAITSVPRFRVPTTYAMNQAATLTYSSLLIDAVTEKVGYIFRVSEAGAITEVGFRNGTHTVNGVADVRLETVDLTTGNPSGTLIGTNANGSQTINAANSWWTTTLTTGPTVAVGDQIAVVIEVPTASTLQTNISVISSGFLPQQFPYTSFFTSSAWAKQTTVPVAALGYTGVYPITEGFYPYSAFSGPVFNSSTAGADERGNRITLPYTARAVAVYAYLDLDAATDIVLYDTNGTTALVTISHDSDVRSTTAAGIFYWPLTTPITMTAGGTYRIVAKPTTTTNIGLGEFSVASAAIMTGAIDAGAEVYLTTRVDAGGWTDTATSRALIGLEFDGMDLGAGFKHHPGMTGFANA